MLLPHNYIPVEPHGRVHFSGDWPPGSLRRCRGRHKITMKSSMEWRLTNHQPIINYQWYPHNPIFLVLNITINQSSFLNDMPMCLMLESPLNIYPINDGEKSRFPSTGVSQHPHFFARRQHSCNASKRLARISRHRSMRKRLVNSGITTSMDGL